MGGRGAGLGDTGGGAADHMHHAMMQVRRAGEWKTLLLPAAAFKMRFFHHGGQHAQHKNARTPLSRRRRDAIKSIYDVNHKDFPYIEAYQEALEETLVMPRLGGGGRARKLPRHWVPLNPLLSDEEQRREESHMQAIRFQDLPMDVTPTAQLRANSVCQPAKEWRDASD